MTIKKLEEILKRVDEIIRLADEVLRTEQHSNYGSNYVSSELFFEFRAAALSFLRNTFGQAHSFCIEFDSQAKQANPYDTKEGRGILRAAKKEIEGGWLFTVKGLVSSEIFTDFLEMAEHLLQETYKDPSAVVIGSVLEEHLRLLCTKNGIDTEFEKAEKRIAKKADSLNADLTAANVYNKLDQKSVTAWLDLRNKAAHGRYSEYTLDQVKIMFDGVTNFIARTM